MPKSKLPAALRKAAQSTLAFPEDGVPVYRLLDHLVEHPKTLGPLMEKFDLNERDLRDAFKRVSALLCQLEELLEGEGTGTSDDAGAETKAEKKSKSKSKKAAAAAEDDDAATAPTAKSAAAKAAPTAPPGAPGKPTPAHLARIAQADRIKIFTDGACSGNPGPMGIAYVMLDMENRVLWEESRAIGHGTNNVAEYSALIMGLRQARQFGKQAVHVFSDSELMVKQIRGEYRVKTPAIVPLIREAQALRREFASFQISHVRREQNSQADALASGAIRGRR